LRREQERILALGMQACLQRKNPRRRHPVLDHRPRYRDAIERGVGMMMLLEIDVSLAAATSPCGHRNQRRRQQQNRGSTKSLFLYSD
jgi:hypothetical protein